MSLLSKFVKETHTFFVTGGIMSLGDFVSQKVIEEKTELDVARNVRFAALGLLWVVSLDTDMLSMQAPLTPLSAHPSSEPRSPCVTCLSLPSSSRFLLSSPPINHAADAPDRQPLTSCVADVLTSLPLAYRCCCCCIDSENAFSRFATCNQPD